MKNSTYAALLLAALLSASCSSGSNSNSSTSASPAATAAAVVPKACDVLTPALAKQLIGPTAKQTINVKPTAHMSHCNYISGGATIDLMLEDDWDFATGDREHSIGHRKVSGIGDEAFEDSTGLYVRKGTTAVEVKATGAEGEYSGSAADAESSFAAKLQQKAAKIIVGRL